MKKFYNNLLSVLLMTLFVNFSQAQEISNLEEKYPIIPTPHEIKYNNAELEFKAISITRSDFQTESNKLESFFKSKGIAISANGLNVQIIKEVLPVDNSEEAYKLSIDTEIKIWASTEKGAYYAIKSLEQVSRQHNGNGVVPKLEITDWPAF